MRILRDLTYGEHSCRRLDLYLPDGEQFPLLLFFHGGGIEGGRKEDLEAVGRQLAAAGIGLASAEYRLYPDAKYPEFIEDAAAAVAWTKAHLNEYGGDKLYVGGSSAGGYLSMMLCFDERWLAPYGMTTTDIDGWVHDAGQPTVHFNVLRERGVDSRRLIVDEAAPLYHIGKAERYSPMLFLVSDNDMENRYEQTMLVLSTLRHFRYDMTQVTLKEMHGVHCQYISIPNEDGTVPFAYLVIDWLNA